MYPVAATAEEPEDKMADPKFIQFMMEKGIDPTTFSPAELDAIYRDYKGEREALAKQQAQAQVMRNSELGGGVNAGQLYFSESPLAAAGTLLKQYRGAKKGQELQAKEAELSEADSLARQAYARQLSAAIRGGGAGGVMGAPGQPQAQGNPSILSPQQQIEMERQRRGMIST